MKKIMMLSFIFGLLVVTGCLGDNDEEKEKKTDVNTEVRDKTESEDEVEKTAEITGETLNCSYEKTEYGIKSSIDHTVVFQQGEPKMVEMNLISEHLDLTTEEVEEYSTFIGDIYASLNEYSGITTSTRIQENKIYIELKVIVDEIVEAEHDKTLEDFIDFDYEMTLEEMRDVLVEDGFVCH